MRVALRVNPGIATGGHDYVATGHDQAKFGVADGQAEIHGNRLKDRRRLARLWETFLEGAA